MSVKFHANIKETFFPNLFFLSIYLTQAFPDLQMPVLSFDRVIGQGIIKNIDTMRTVTDFYQYILGAMLLFFLGACVWTKLYKYLDTKNKDDINICAILGIAYNCCVLGQTTTDLIVIIWQFLAVTIWFLLFKHARTLEKMTVFFVFFLCFTFFYKIYNYYPELIFSVGMTICSIGCLTILLYVFYNLLYDKKNFSRTIVTVFALPLLTSVYFESINVLNQHAIFITAPLKIYALFLFGVLTLIFVWDYLYPKKLKLENYYILILIGVTAILNQPLPVQELAFGLNSSNFMAHPKPVLFHLYETANSSILIDSFVRYGELPIIHYFGAHMLEGFFSGVLWFMLNKDALGAAFSPYFHYLGDIIITVVFYYTLLKIYDNKILALFTLLLIPFYNVWYAYAAGLFVYFSMIRYISKPTKFNAALVCIVSLAVMLYRLDLGMSFVAAEVAAFLWLIIVKKRYDLLRYLLYMGIIFVVSGCLLFCGTCVFYGISPFSRLQELLAVINSGNNWATGKFASFNVQSQKFFLFYMFLPIAIGTSLIYRLCDKNALNTKNIEKTILLFILGCAYLANFHRMIVRHNLAEYNVPAVRGMLLWTAGIYAIVFIVTTLRKEKLYPIFLALLTLCFPSSCFLETSIQRFDSTLLQIQKIHQNSAKDKQPFRRILMPTNDEYIKAETSLINTINRYLASDETYLDFCNRTTFYPILERKNPAYVAQMPMLLSGEVSQEKLVENLKTHITKIPFVLIPEKDHNESTRLDGVDNVVRYYKLSEFINQNYRPFLFAGDFSIWVHNDRHEEFFHKLLPEDLPNYFFEIELEIHSYDIGYLPYLWGEKDKKNASQNKVIREVSTIDNNTYLFALLDPQEKIKGNYILLELKTESEINAKLMIGIYDGRTFQEKLSYAFKPQKGIHKYIFRVSTDIHWYEEPLNAIQLPDIPAVNILNVKVLEGD